MWNEMTKIIKRVAKETLENQKIADCKPRKIGSGVGRYKKQLQKRTQFKTWQKEEEIFIYIKFDKGRLYKKCDRRKEERYIN